MLTTLKMDKLKKIYTWLIVLLPLLSVYGWKKCGLDFGTILVFVLFLILFAFSKKRIRTKFYFLWYIFSVYIVLGELFFLMCGEIYNSYGSAVLRSVKFVLYIVICLISVSNEFCDYKYMVKYYLKTAMFATTYILLQTILYYMFHIKLWGYTNFFLFEPGYAIRLTAPVYGLFRPTSLFYEPAHYFEYVFFAIIILLFFEQVQEKKIYKAIYITLGIILSTSGQGIVCAASIWCFWILRYLVIKGYRRAVHRSLFVILCGGLVAVVLFVRSTPGQQIIERVVNPNAVGGNAVEGRLGSYLYLADLSIKERVFGTGYGNIPTGYFANWASNLWCLGIVGSLIVLGIYIKSYRSAWRTEVKVLIVLHAVLCFTTTLFMGKYILFYFMFILSGNLENKERQKEYAGKKETYCNIG